MNTPSPTFDIPKPLVIEKQNLEHNSRLPIPVPPEDAGFSWNYKHL